MGAISSYSSRFVCVDGWMDGWMDRWIDEVKPARRFSRAARFISLAGNPEWSLVVNQATVDRRMIPDSMARKRGGGLSSIHANG